MPDPSTVTQVQDLANEIHRLSAECGRADLGDRLRGEAERYQQPETTVVLVGATNQGKSSLINALLGRSGFLPVDSDVTTSAHIAVRHGDVLEATVHCGDAQEPLVVPMDQLASWTTVDGNPDNEKNVRAVVITCPHPLLSTGLVLVDTPGLGGLDGSHADLTLAALPSADVLLFVSDASAPLSESELRFLERSTERIGTIIFVVTKADAYRGWRTMVDDDRSLLEHHAPTLASVPILGVSSRMALAAANASPDQEALRTRGRAESRVDDLTARLMAMARQSSAVKLVNLVRVSQAVLAELERVEAGRIQSTLQDPEWSDGLERERLQLDQLMGVWNRWRADLATHFDRLALDVDTQGDLALARLEQQLQDRVREHSKELLDNLASELDAALAAVWADLENLIADRVALSIAGLAEQLMIESVDADIEQLLPPDYLNDAADLRRKRADSADRKGWEEAFVQSYPILISAGLPLTFGSMLSQLGVAGAAVLAGPVGVVIGAGFAGVMLTARRRQTKRARTKQAAGEFVRLTLSDARRALAKESRQQLAEIRRTLEETIGTALADRRREVEQRFQELQRLADEDTQVRQRAQAAAERRRRDAADLHQRANELRQALLDPLAT